VETLNRKSKRGLSRCLHLIATGNGAHKKNDTYSLKHKNFSKSMYKYSTTL
jgi:hypothetical protein